MLARDAFMDFTYTFDAILQFRAQWRQKLRDGKDSSSPLQVRSLSTVEPVSAPPKWKLEIRAQRPAPEILPARIELPKITDQRLGVPA